MEAIRVLRRFRNAILEGPPGTGKTHVVAEIASLWAAETGRPLKGDGDGEYAITFHPSTTYDEFIEGLRYDDAKQQFVRRDGFLRKIIEEAEASPDMDFLVLLDEINRANVPKVLGDVLLCMEATKRSHYDANAGDWTDGVSVTLPYSGATFSIPDNVFLLGTMNTSDRSIAPLDSALRRRFGFVRVEPLLGSALADTIEAIDGKDAREHMARSIDELTNLNAVLRECLGPDAVLGHSYLFGVTGTVGTTSTIADPLSDVRDVVKRRSSKRGFWLQSRGMFFGAKNQMDLPGPDTRRHGVVDLFYPMSSNGHTTVKRGTGGGKGQDPFDLHYQGKTLAGNTIEYNEGGSNNRLKLQGKTAPPDDRKIGSFIPTGNLQHKLHVWLARPDDTFDFLLLDYDPANLAALQAASVWTERTGGSGGRDYGQLDLGAVLSSAPAQPNRSSDDDAEWMVWRYAVLPQLIDLLTQFGSVDLVDPDLRVEALKHLGKEGLVDRLERFDEFLAEHLSLYLGIEGNGLMRGVVISSSPLRTVSTGTSSSGAAVDVESEDAESDESTAGE